MCLIEIKGEDMKVRITKSNTSFVRVGEITEITELHGQPHRMWSDFCNRYEDVSWCERLWGVKYEVLEEASV